jgi:hypothetical protein
MGMLQQSLLKALQLNGFGVACHPRKQADAGLDQSLGGDLAPGQYEIADRDLFKAPAFARPAPRTGRTRG